MRIFLRTFNDSINSKSGAPLPAGQKRGTPEWLIFQDILHDVLRELGHDLFFQPEHPLIPDFPTEGMDKRIYVHQTKREKPQGDLFWMQMHLKDMFTVDTNGWGADNSSNEFSPHFIDQDTATRYCQELSDQLHASGESKCPQPQETGETPAKFILVPVQIPRDYTIIHHSPVTVKYFMESIQAWAVETQNHVVFKMHPHNTRDYDLHKVVDDASANSHYVHKAEGNIHELIKRSAGLFVINSGTGYEALIHGRPVCTFGDCDYRVATFNADLRRLDEARNFLFSYKEEWRQLAYKFCYWYCTEKAYRLSDPSMKERLTNYLKGVLNA